MLLRRLALAAALFALLVLAACSKSEVTPAEDPEAARAKAAETLAAQREELTAKTATLDPVKAKWEMGETKSAVTGYYEGDVLKVIEEQMSMGEFGEAAAKYFYNPAGKLFAYTEQKVARSGVKTDAVKTERVDLLLLFDQNGALVSGERKVDRSAAALIGIEEQSVRMHARELEAVLAEARAKSAK